MLFLRVANAKVEPRPLHHDVAGGFTEVLLLASVVPRHEKVACSGFLMVPGAGIPSYRASTANGLS